MSGSLPADVKLDARLGVGAAPGRRRITLGSDAVISVTVRDSQTGKTVPGATGVSALYWLPGTVGDQAAAQPLVPVEAAPGDWRMTVPGRIPGSHGLWFLIQGPVRKVVQLVFDVGSTGQLSLTSQRTVPWSDIEAAGAAAGASAALAEIGLIAADYVRPAVAEAVADELKGVSEAAATAARQEVASQLGGMATKSQVEALGQQVDRKASLEALQAIGKRVDDKADTAAVKRTTDALGERVAKVEQAPPPKPDVTTLAVVKALGIPTADFSDPANSGLFALI